LADIVETNIDVDALLDLLPDIKGPDAPKKSLRTSQCNLVKLGVASDNAFCFYYQDNLDLLETNGAEIVHFSPTEDKGLPDELDGLYFGGGYPELYAQKLAENRHMCDQIRFKQKEGMPIYGECGGFMYLCEEITDLEGNRYSMVGCFPFTTRMFSRLKALGYREITFAENTILGKRDQTVRGHEFHYSELTQNHSKLKTAYKIAARAGAVKSRGGYQIGRCLGSYVHLHFESCPDVAGYFVKSCEQYRQERLAACETKRNRVVEL
jgi:cobyrinic acid a,c-diamide synthase